MRVLLCTMSLIVVVTFSGCETSDTKEPATASQQSLAVVPSTQTESVKLVVRLCEPLDSATITALVSTHRLSLVRRPSPTLAVLTWNDTRTADAVMAGLRRDNAICGVEIEQTYQANPTGRK